MISGIRPRLALDLCEAWAHCPNLTARRTSGSSCAKLNSQENIWQFMRQNWLSNRVFKSYDDIVDHCCYAWNTLIAQPWKIMSIGLREWAYIGRSI